MYLLPKPKCALRPPKFLTRNIPDCLKLQLSIKPKSDSNTHVPQANPKKRVIKEKKKKRKQTQKNIIEDLKMIDSKIYKKLVLGFFLQRDFLWND